MYGFIRGFQRWVWWPKCAPASSNCCMVTTLVAIGYSPSGSASAEPCNRPIGRHRYVSSTCGMAAPLAEASPAFKGLALKFDVGGNSFLTSENKAGTLFRPRSFGAVGNGTKRVRYGCAAKPGTMPMLAPFATLAFLATLWLIAAIGTELFARS